MILSTTVSHRKATISDLPQIIMLLVEDELGQTRESSSPDGVHQCYFNAFERINQDSNQYLMVVEKDNQVIATCHLTLVPSLTLRGTLRLQIEAVRVSKAQRSQGIGEWMITQAIAYGQEKGASLAQLTTNKARHRAKEFYERLGFKATHEGMKLPI